MEKIVLKTPENFVARDILECGQVFRYEKDSEENYSVFALNKKATIFEKNGDVEIVCSDKKFFENYFDLQSDYSQFPKKFRDNEVVQQAYVFGKGIRILKQDLTEMIFSFLISQNNNIKRIQKILKNMCTVLGEDCGGFHSFPSVEVLAKQTKASFDELGCGYRSDFLLQTARDICAGFDLQALHCMDTSRAREQLLKLKGVGPKVADCILLFGLGKKDVFPVDTWMEKVYHAYFESGHSLREMPNFFVDLFGQDAGIAQQYLFHFQRTMVDKLEKRV